MCTVGGKLVSQQLKMLSRRPARSVNSWDKLLDNPYWSERKR